MIVNAEIESDIEEVNCSVFNIHGAMPEHFLQTYYNGGLTIVLVHTFNLRENGVLVAQIRTKHNCNYPSTVETQLRRAHVSLFAKAAIFFSTGKLSEKISEILGFHCVLKTLSDDELEVLVSTVWAGQN